MKKVMNLLCNIFILCLVFCGGFYIGLTKNSNSNYKKTLDTTASEKKYMITSMCADPYTIHSSATENDTDTEKNTDFFSYCFCFISDNGKDFTSVDLIDERTFNSNIAEDALAKCEKDCQRLCEQNVQKWLRQHKNYTPAI